jgi:hypothetical protein
MDGHHEMRACKELGFPVTSTSRTSGIALKMESMIRKLAAERQARTRFTSESAKEASDQYWKGACVRGPVHKGSGVVPSF